MSKLDLHCDLAYLEYALEQVIREHVKIIIQETMNLLYSHFRENRIRCKFIENSKGNYDLHIWSKLCINYDFVSFIKEYCGLDKLMNKYYDKVEEASGPNYGFLDGNKEYTKQYVFYDFTEEEVASLIAFFNINQYPGINYKEVIRDLINRTIEYNFNKLLLDALHWDNALDKYAILEKKPYDITIYTVNRIDALEAWHWLIHKCPDSVYHISNSISHTNENTVLWAHEYNWFFDIHLNEKEYLGLCHILTRAKEIYNE